MRLPPGVTRLATISLKGNWFPPPNPHGVNPCPLCCVHGPLEILGGSQSPGVLLKLRRPLQWAHLKCASTKSFQVTLALLVWGTQFRISSSLTLGITDRCKPETIANPKQGQTAPICGWQFSSERATNPGPALASLRAVIPPGTSHFLWDGT